MLKSECDKKRETTETNASRELFNQLTTAFGGGVFISQWKRWRGVFTPARANENKTIHRFTRYPLCVWSTMQANYVGELCGTNCIGEPCLNYV